MGWGRCKTQVSQQIVPVRTCTMRKRLDIKKPVLVLVLLLLVELSTSSCTTQDIFCTLCANISTSNVQTILERQLRPQTRDLFRKQSTKTGSEHFKETWMLCF